MFRSGRGRGKLCPAYLVCRLKELPVENLLLAKLSGETLDALHPHCERVTLKHGDHAIVPDEPIRHFYFPAGCLLSMVTTMTVWT